MRGNVRTKLGHGQLLSRVSRLHSLTRFLGNKVRKLVLTPV
jgi:hypothetical protein